MISIDDSIIEEIEENSSEKKEKKYKNPLKVAPNVWIEDNWGRTVMQNDKMTMRIF